MHKLSFADKPELLRALSDLDLIKLRISRRQPGAFLFVGLVLLAGALTTSFGIGLGATEYSPFFAGMSFALGLASCALSWHQHSRNNEDKLTQRNICDEWSRWGITFAEGLYGTAPMVEDETGKQVAFDPHSKRSYAQ
jgi:hypothetical protein